MTAMRCVKSQINSWQRDCWREAKASTPRYRSLPMDAVGCVAGSPANQYEGGRTWRPPSVVARVNGSGAVADFYRQRRPQERALFEELRTLRRRLADEQGVPAFVVFSDATLHALASAMPMDEQSMLRVSVSDRRSWNVTASNSLPR